MSDISKEAHLKIISELQDLHRFGEWAAQRGVEQDCRCSYCDRDLLASFNDYNSWQFDHIIPSPLDGEHSYENVTVCRRAYNYLKMNYVPTGNTREERILDARSYVQEKRAKHEAEIAAVRLLIRGVAVNPQ